ncbi:adenosine kinase [Novosphingopyxis baekryungensis]|uniref:adenosine kinase n=1 Tax=Novosphingopyxis baekryungensis TaxID=279369 RepID=UPI0003B664C5|nr:adenosine kinase [Novosphingopyxis baekryungensis]
MTQTRYDVLAIGNAIVDVLASTTDDFITEENLTKGGMALIDADRAVSLYDKMGSGQEISGGAAANTLAGLAMLGAKCQFIGQVAKDQLGEVYAHDLRAVGVDFTQAPRDAEPPTGRCLILVSPDGERTMNTFLGASHFLPAEAIDQDAIANARLVFLEGYMWDPPEPRAAMRRALEIARQSDTQVAFSTCADFCVHTHRKDFRKLIDDGLIDILFANEEEAGILEDSDPASAIETLGKDVPLLVVTRGPQGAIAIKDGERFETTALPTTVVDTTGAGDLFAAGFLSGHLQGESVTRCLEMGAVAAAEVVSHFGARPEQDLKKLMAEKLG